MKPVDETIATEAVNLVTGDRQKAYGHPSKNFEDIARLWSVVLGIEVTPAQVGLCMIQVKIAREVFVPKRDNLLDIVGYVLTVDACKKEEDNEKTNRFVSTDSIDDLINLAGDC